jgi:hypothetical protein
MNVRFREPDRDPDGLQLADSSKTRSSRPALAKRTFIKFAIWPDIGIHVGEQ